MSTCNYIRDPVDVANSKQHRGGTHGRTKGKSSRNPWKEWQVFKTGQGRQSNPGSYKKISNHGRDGSVDIDPVGKIKNERERWGEKSSR